MKRKKQFFLSISILPILLFISMASSAITIKVICPDNTPIKKVSAQYGGMFAVLNTKPAQTIYSDLSSDGEMTIPSEWRWEQVYIYTQGFVSDGYCKDAHKGDFAHLISKPFVLKDNLTINVLHP